MKRSKTLHMTTMTMLVAMGLIINLIEPPFPIGVPGVKFGLANIVGIFAFYMYGTKELFVVNGMRVLIASLLRGTFLGTGFWLASSGMILSSLAVVCFARWSPLSEIGVSTASATFHNIGQIMVISFIVKTGLIVTYLPFMLFMGVPTGIVSGYLIKYVVDGFARSGAKGIFVD